jgi:CysZ protein
MNPAPGIRAFTEGLRVSRHPALRHYTWMPLLVSLLVVGAGLYFALDYLTGAAENLVARLPDWLSWLSALLKPLLYVLGVLIGAWLLAFLAVLLSSPFLGAYSMALERIHLGKTRHPDSALWTDITSSIGREFRKLLYYLPRLLLVFLITLIPVVNLAAPVIWLLFGAWTLAVQFTDYPTENRQQPFQVTLEKLRANKVAALAFGACASVALMIPLLNFLLIPVAVAGGTLLWHQLEDSTSAAGN